MSEPTGPARDSSLGINKAPGNMFSCREAQTVEPDIGFLDGCANDFDGGDADCFSASQRRLRRRPARLLCQSTRSGTATSSTQRPATCPADGWPAMKSDNEARQSSRKGQGGEQSGRAASCVRCRGCRRTMPRRPPGKARTGNGHGCRDRPARAVPRRGMPVPTRRPQQPRPGELPRGRRRCPATRVSGFCDPACLSPSASSQRDPDRGSFTSRAG